MESFDLTNLARETDAEARHRRTLVRIIGLLFGAIAVIGVYLLLFPTPGHAATFYTGPLLLVVFGILVFLFSTWAVRGIGPAPRRLTVSPQHLSFEAFSDRPDAQLVWDDPDLRFRLFDVRALPKIRPNGKPRNVEFIVDPVSCPRTPVPQAAFDAILREAENHGLRLVRRTQPSRGPGTIQVTTVLARR
jgi:hypothetical protein